MSHEDLTQHLIRQDKLRDVIEKRPNVLSIDPDDAVDTIKVIEKEYILVDSLFKTQD